MKADPGDSDGLSDYDLLTFIIMALYRVDPGFFLNGLTDDIEINNWNQGAIHSISKIQAQPVRLACMRAFENFAAFPVFECHGISYVKEVFQWMYCGA